MYFTHSAHLSSNRSAATLNSTDPEAECGLGGSPETEDNEYNWLVGCVFCVGNGEGY